MFTDAELSRCQRIAKRAAAGRPQQGYIFGGNPADIGQRWDIYSRNQPITPKPQPKLTLGRSIGMMGQGLASQAGNYAQTMFTGHHGQPSFLGNVYGAVAGQLSGDKRYTTKQLWGRGGRVWAPWREAAPELNEAWSNTGAPAEYVTNKAMNAYHWLRHQLVEPRYYGRA